MVCAAEGDQPISIVWSLESSTISKSNDKYEIVETITDNGVKSELNIRSAERSDGGLYVCVAENSYGKDERSNKVLVIEVPAGPTNLVSREAWSRSVSISWTAPFAGNSPITGYVIQYWRKNEKGDDEDLKEARVTSSQTSFLLNELEPSSSYGMTVQAENEVGRGPTSNVIFFETGEEEPSSAPTDVFVESRWPTTIKVSWKAPPKGAHNDKIVGYYVGFKPTYQSSHYSFMTVPAEGVNKVYEYFLRSLVKDTQYSIIVKAYNKAGSGPESKEYKAKTLSGNLPSSPNLYIKSITADSIDIIVKMFNGASNINSYNIHYQLADSQDRKTLTLTSLEFGDDGQYTLQDLKPNSSYKIYVTASNNYGNGDPSRILTARTRSTHEDMIMTGSIFSIREGNSDLLALYSDLIPILSTIIAVAIVIIVLIIAFVCVRKAQLEACKPSFDKCSATLPRMVETSKTGTYIGTTHRYLEVDKSKPMMMSNHGVINDSSFPTPYSTMPMRDPFMGQITEEMKSFHTQKPKMTMKDRPLPNPDGAKHGSGHHYDFPQ